MENFTANYSRTFMYYPTCSCLFVWLAVNLFLLSSCSEDIKLTETVLEDNKGSLSIYIDGIPSARTILPQNIDWSSFTGAFEIVLTETDSGFTLAPITRSIHNLSDPIQLDEGNYNVTVTAFRSAGVPVSRGAIDIIVTAGIPAAHILRMRAIVDAGYGTFNWDITIPAVDTAQMRITQIDGTLAGAAETLTQGANTGSRNLNSGYYFVITELTRTDHADIIRRDILHVYQNMTSVFTIGFSDNMFNNNLHTVILDYNYNSMFSSEPVIHGEKAALPSPDPERISYGFAGWYTDVALTTLYDFDTPVSIDITLYAKWTPNQITITLIDIDNMPAVLGVTFTPAVTPNITLSRSGAGGNPVTQNITVNGLNAGDTLSWSIKGKGINANQSVTGTTSPIILDANNIIYNSFGWHSAELNIVKGSVQYRTSFMFQIIQ